MVQYTEIYSSVKNTKEKLFTSQDAYLWQHPGGGYCKFIHYGAFWIFRQRVNSRFQYIPQFALYPHVHDATSARIVNIFEVIAMMKGEDLKRKSRAIKEAADRGDDALKDRLKERMPYVCHAGIFIPRNNASLLHPNFCYQLDIDKGKNPNMNPDEVLQKLIKDRNLNLLIASKSPSGKGIKGILFLKELLYIRDVWEWEEYRSTYHKATDILERYFLQMHGVKIDTQMKSISQPLYLFYSDDLFINEDLKR